MRRRTEGPQSPFTRRDLLKAGALAGALGTVGPLGPLTAGAVPTEAAGDTPATAAGAFELEELSIAELQAGLTAGRWTARSLTESYLTRIAALDRQGPALHAVIETNPDALAIADALDAERKAKGPRGPLHGIPVLIKDNIDTADRMQTTAGSLALVGSEAARDAFVAARLREAGAVILGKTNLSEWANFRSTHSSSGWSGRGGQCRNPYALDRTPSGSSSGSGAAVAANFAAAPSAPRPTARSSRPPPPAASSASSRPSAWSAGPASSRSRTPRTPPARWPAPWPTPRSCSAPWPASTSATRPPAAVRAAARRSPTTRNSSIRTVSKARASAYRASAIRATAQPPTTSSPRRSR